MDAHSPSLALDACSASIGPNNYHTKTHTAFFFWFRLVGDGNDSDHGLDCQDTSRYRPFELGCAAVDLRRMEQPMMSMIQM
jgi:hypothetical protein